MVGCASAGTPETTSSSTTEQEDAGATTVSSTSSTTEEDAGTDSGVDAGSGDFAVCVACEPSAGCGTNTLLCVDVSPYGNVCLERCSPEIDTCPSGFSCSFPAGGTEFVCLPTGQDACCVDGDDDGYGTGVSCLGTDCNDADPGINSGASEICNGVDDNCDEVVDEAPTDCASGRCEALSDGTYQELSGGNCAEAACVGATPNSCALFTCNGEGAEGDACATSCLNEMGAPDNDLCIETAFCNPAGVCISKFDDGQTCSEDFECGSDHCGNGFCCEGSGDCCDGTNDSCGTGTTNVCEDADACQGTRGETVCSPDTFQCSTVGGIADDSGCNGDVSPACGLYRARACDPGNPTDCIYVDACSGSTDQWPSACIDSCQGDADCIDTAYCDSTTGNCIQDTGAGGFCDRDNMCQAGNVCGFSDGGARRCCDQICDGPCQSCNSDGMCVNVAAGTDPKDQCDAVDCSDYYAGFDDSDMRTCYRRRDVEDNAAACDGAGACQTADALCPLQGKDFMRVVADCDETCQTVDMATCDGQIQGTCTNINPGQLMCGMGECATTVDQCVGGVEQTCTPPTGNVETCDNLDNDCDGQTDEDFVDDANATCQAPMSIGPVTTGAGVTTTGARRILDPTGSHWYRITFPTSGNRDQPGNARVSFATGADEYRFEVYNDCAGTTASCGSGMFDNNTSYNFEDNVDDGDSNGFRTRSTAWPSEIFIRVYRANSDAAENCSTYTLNVVR